jgi:membrane protein YqaA with SNARE-associated domain
MARSLFIFFRHLGALGLFLFGAIDSSFLFFLPFGNDFLLIALTSANRQSLIWISYVLMSALGSLVGVLFTDLVARKLGEKGLEKFVKPKKIARLKSRLEKNTGWTILTASLLPPPFPFTAVAMTASALQCARRKMLIAVFCGRLIRFTIEALLALRFGNQVIAFMNSRAVEYVIYFLIFISIAGSVFSIYKWLSGRKESSQAKKTGAEEMAAEQR